MSEPSTSCPAIINRLQDQAELAFAMLAGMELDVFTALSDGPKPLEDVATALDVLPDKLEPLMYALVAAGLLAIHDGPQFSNSDEAHRFLVHGKPENLWHRATAMAFKWANLLSAGRSIKTGIPQAKLNFSDDDTDALIGVLRGMIPTSRRIARELAAVHDLSAATSLADVGGGAGGLALELTEIHPHLKATVIDLPNVTPIARQVIAEAGANGRVDTAEADILAGPLAGNYDVIVCKSFFQVLSREQCAKAAQNIIPAVSPGGSFYAISRMIDTSRLSPISAVTFNLDIVSSLDAGGAYTQTEYQNWFSSAGFTDFETIPLSGGMTVISGKNPG